MLTVALVGHGYWGPNLLRNYTELPGACVKTVCDIREEALDRARLRYPALSVTTDYERVLKDDEVDAVLIATPISTHYRLAMSALKAGKHVFVEKPIAAAAAEALALTETAAENGLTLMVGHTFVFSPPVKKVKEIIDSGALGRVQQAHAHDIKITKEAPNYRR